MWIKVADKLPIDPMTVNNFAEVDVIVATRFGDVFPTTYQCGNTIKDKPWFKFKDCAEGNYITHWMPMPLHPSLC